MTSPRVSLLQNPTYKYAQACYGSSEQWNTFRISSKTSFGGTLSADSGVVVTTEPTKYGMERTSEPAFEVKYKQDFGKADVLGTDIEFHAYMRYRNVNIDKNQLRLAAGGSIPLNDNLSIYADAHYTTNLEGNNKIGCWIGADYKVNDKVSVWVEPVQYNHTLGGGNAVMSNFGVSINF